ncbi:energy transducer TonB [Flavobacterium sp. WV_118_3]|uniref:energy transducer TonB n=1 Tax=Flavobacterium sp. WV_118_3 TaxID=3151764 RepID=UPI00321A74FD
MSIKLKVMALCLMISVSVLGQSEIKYEGETINRIDKDGKKYGVWKLFDKDKGIKIVVKMENDAFTSNIDYYRNEQRIVSQDKTDPGKYHFYVDSKPVPVKIIVENDKRKVVQENGKALDEKSQEAFFSVLEVKTMYYGGESVLRRFLANASSGDWDNSASLQLRWSIDKNGGVENIKVIKSDNEALNEKAIQIIQKMPRWQPGFSNGRFLKGMYSTGIRFMAG